MQIKMIEIRDEGTCIPAMAILLSCDTPALTTESDIQFRFLRRAGFDGQTGIVLMRLNDQETHADAYNWPVGPRTMRAAHLYIEAHWDELKSGDVVDARVQLGMATEHVAGEI